MFLQPANVSTFNKSEKEGKIKNNHKAQKKADKTKPKCMPASNARHVSGLTRIAGH
jgi:hypothetical protein